MRVPVTRNAWSPKPFMIWPLENERKADQVTETTTQNKETVGGTQIAIEPDEGEIADEIHWKVLSNRLPRRTLLGSTHRPSIPAKDCTRPPIRILFVQGEPHLIVRQPVTNLLLQSLEPPPFRGLHTVTHTRITVRVHSIRTKEIVLFPAHLLRLLAPFTHRGTVSETPH